MRVAFGAYQAHRFRPDIYGPEVSALDPIVVVPRGERTLVEMLEVCRRPAGAPVLAESSSARIPVAARGLELLASDYTRSPLAAFHRQFFSAPLHDPSSWPETYDSIRAGAGSAVRRGATRHAERRAAEAGTPSARDAVPHEPGLGAPAYRRARLVEVRSGLQLGHALAVLSARSRAEFDVRVFAGMLVAGLDRCVDFNCQSTQEKTMCPGSGCPHDLRVARERLLRQVDRG